MRTSWTERKKVFLFFFGELNLVIEEINNDENN